MYADVVLVDGIVFDKFVVDHLLNEERLVFSMILIY